MQNSVYVYEWQLPLNKELIELKCYLTVVVLIVAMLLYIMLDNSLELLDVDVNIMIVLKHIISYSFPSLARWYSAAHEVTDTSSCMWCTCSDW